jgi:hypothetical protein
MKKLKLTPAIAGEFLLWIYTKTWGGKFWLICLLTAWIECAIIAYNQNYGNGGKFYEKKTTQSYRYGVGICTCNEHNEQCIGNKSVS